MVDRGAASTDELGEAQAPSDECESMRFYTCSEDPARIIDKAVIDKEVVSPPMDDEAEVPSGSAGEDEDEYIESAKSTVQEDLVSDDAHDAGVSVASDGEPADPPMELDSVSDLLPGESTVASASTRGKGGSEVVLTNWRVLLRGAPEAKVLHASMRLTEIDSLEISRARPGKRSLVWGLIGIGAAIGMWQALDGAGNVRLFVAALVVFMSGLLLVDYFLRPPDLQVVFRARSGVEMIVEFAQSHADEADRFAAQVLVNLESSKSH